MIVFIILLCMLFILSIIQLFFVIFQIKHYKDFIIAISVLEDIVSNLNTLDW